MTEQQMPSDEAIMRGLNANPQIKSRIASMLAVVEDAAGDLKEADAAEMRLIEEIRRMGQEAMQAWANRQIEITEQDVRRGGQVQREGKKTLLAHHLWRHQCRGAAMASRNQAGARLATAGQQLFGCATRAGFGARTPIHAVGDGAPWIADQVEDPFGAQGSYLLDFFHVCDYLSAAAKAIVVDADGQKRWMDEQKIRLKTQRADELLQGLQAHLEEPDVEDSNAPVRQCHRYLSHRREQLNYQGALERDLPIGSGEIESAHRHIVQQRLKRPGAWWRAANAEHMLALRLNRANRQWDGYWATDFKLAA